MLHDKQITICSAGSRQAEYWKAETLHWSELVVKLRHPNRSIESLQEYLRLPKAKQDALKDVGGYVGGILKNGRRTSKNVLERHIIALDLDNIPSEGTEAVLLKLKALGCAYAVYSTRKHEPIKPRLRVLIPLSRPSTADEYEPIARKMAERINVEWCDPTTFQASRLMYWPSCSRDSQYIYAYEDKPFLDTDGVLRMYRDWQNVEEWPQVPGEKERHQKAADRQQDPTQKKGVVGAFCRIYDVHGAIREFLSDAYTATEDAGRYTFAGGSTFGGAIVYGDGLFLYSHHATDPAGGHLCNAFDLVRLHKFAQLDDDAKANTPVNRLPSYQAMSEFAVNRPEVVTLLNKERFEDATSDFSVEVPDEASWFSLLKTGETGAPAKTVDNVCIILDHDPNLKGKIVYDEFANRTIATGALPWNTCTDRRVWDDVDDAGLRQYIEKAYLITGKDRIYDAAMLCAFKNKINPVKDYLKSLRWDGKSRVETLLIDYLGAEDTAYTRAAIRKALTAAVARVMCPGTKFDAILVLIGAQGIGKSTLLRILGLEWYSDSLTTFEGKEAAELIQGNWIIEVGELSGLSKSETNTVKQFLSRVDDVYRQPYGRRTARFPRQCVFFGTTNDDEFLKDRTGNRRFWPVAVGVNPPVKSVFEDLTREEVDQIWAEAFVFFQLGEALYMPKELEEMARAEQDKRLERSPKEGAILDFVEKKVPSDWQKYTLEQRQAYWSFEHKSYRGELVFRDRICAVEIWVECFGKSVADMRRYDTAEINGVLSSISVAKKNEKAMRFGPHGPQKGYYLVENEE